MKQPPRSYDNLLMLLTMAGVQWDEACRVAKEFASKPTRQVEEKAA